mgnify:FL=1|jgi:uncharacterized protein YkwD
MNKHFNIFLLFLSTLSFGQTQTEIDLTQLKTKILQLVNEERKSVAVTSLTLDTFLWKAAEDHAKYIAKVQTLTHEQTNSKKNPKERVYFYGGNAFELVGENLLFTGIKNQIYSNEDLDALALKIVQLWKKSPNHLKNIINPKYTFTEIGFSIDLENKKIYVVQLFGAK